MRATLALCVLAGCAHQALPAPCPLEPPPVMERVDYDPECPAQFAACLTSEAALEAYVRCRRVAAKATAGRRVAE